MSRRAIKGVLDNFLGTYTSRYSDYNGYWLFGMLIGDVEEMSINLLSSTENESPNTPLGTATKLAIQKFREQMEKAGLDLSYAREASVHFKKLPGAAEGFVNGRICPGHTIQFVARVVSHSGYAHERERRVFVAPHNPQFERKSDRTT
jgi:hypothetical protein